MKSMALFVIVLLLPLLAEGHPGKTDRYGGHKCLKGCEEWGLFYKEYHLHDKDGRPIRVNKTKAEKKGETPIIAEPQSSITETIISKTVTTHYYVANIYEENVFPLNPFLYILLTLLLLLLILRMNRKKEKS